MKTKATLFTSIALTILASSLTVADVLLSTDYEDKSRIKQPSKDLAAKGVKSKDKVNKLDIAEEAKPIESNDRRISERLRHK
ncbi:MAG: hypothetical protein COA90_10330 [Gammaproteobacteria bacterium]|nr:MAG: hypothetical protein COA90_10330 [Gammaproteobacteria bacterium]